jgi:TctA family transporter
MFVGVLPGMGAMSTIAMLLPLTWRLEPSTALILLAAIFYGGQYGGSTTSILLNLPGTAANAVTGLDGYPMARQGRAGVALLVTTLSSFVGASIAILLLMTLAPALGRFALAFGSPEYFAAMTFALVAASTVSGHVLKGVAMVALGTLLGLIGIDIGTGGHRFTFGLIELAGGLSLVALATGLFGVTEILWNLAHGQNAAQVSDERITFRSLVPTREDLRASALPSLRGSLLGILCGILPGTGATLASFLSYSVERRVAADPSGFGKGAIAGVAGPEAANNAAVQAAFIPTLALGVPGDAVMAMLLGVMVIHGVAPGPLMLTDSPALFWGIVASFWVGNLVLLILNIPLIGVWVRILRVPYDLLYPIVISLVAVGVYSINYSSFDVVLVAAIGLVGYGMRRLDYPAAPLLFGFILGPMMEDHLRRALLIGGGDLTVLVGTPVSAAFHMASLSIVVMSSVSLFRHAMASRAVRDRRP